LISVINTKPMACQVSALVRVLFLSSMRLS
jgi:hypothetical protein